MNPLLPPVQFVPDGSVTARFATEALSIAGLVIFAGVAAGGAAAVYRWYARERVPESLAVLAGLAVVAVYLNTYTALGQVIGGGTGLLDPDEALVNTVVFVLAGATSLVGRRAGDRLAQELGVVSGSRELDVEISRLVRTVGRVIAVTLPSEPDAIRDIEGYDPVAEEVKASLVGKTLLFPRGLTVGQLNERLAERLRDDYGIGHVDVELDEAGTVEFVAVGSRAAGIGPTLPPGSAATALLADPPFSATSGDVVQVWLAGHDAEPERLATAELRAHAGDVVTLALDAADAESLDPERRYRLVTMPREPRADREFASLLRAADDTMSVVSVEEGSALVETPLKRLDVTVVAIEGADGGVDAIPRQSRTLSAGDRLYAIARPEALRRLEASGTAVTESPEAEPS